MIKFQNITKKYKDTLILENASYTFPAKGMVCLMGASGSGKTTLLNLLAGFDTDYEGEILVGGTAIHQMNAEALCEYRRNNVGFVFQNYHLLPGYTVLENMCLASALFEESEEESQKKAITLLTQLGIGGKKNQKVETLSGGQKQRVAIARALMGTKQILFADEPTGALDRETSTEIMKILQKIAGERLVVVITHDPKICSFADEVISIQKYQIVSEKNEPNVVAKEQPLILGKQSKVSVFSRAVKNFKIHTRRYMMVSIVLSIGLLAFLFSLSFQNVMEYSIQNFKEKNTAFHNGYIKEGNENIFHELKKEERVENVYKQYKLENINLVIGEKRVNLPEKFPMPKATESLSYGVMPQNGKNEISLTPSLAKKFTDNINYLLGKSMTLEFQSEKYEVTICGVYNAGYDDFFLSSDLEQILYQNQTGGQTYSISYDVKNFEDIVAVSKDLKQKGIDAKTAEGEVAALQNTFGDLKNLFFVISVLFFGIGLFVCIILLTKLQNTRYREMGLLSALGFNIRQISTILRSENLLLSSLAAGINFILLMGSVIIGKLLKFPMLWDGIQIGFSVLATFILISVISHAVSYRLLRMDPAVALRK